VNGFFNALHAPEALMQVRRTSWRATRPAASTFAHAMTKTMLHQEWAMTRWTMIEAEAQASAPHARRTSIAPADAFAAKQNWCSRATEPAPNTPAHAEDLPMTPTPPTWRCLLDDVHRELVRGWPTGFPASRSMNDRRACREWVQRLGDAGCATAYRLVPRRRMVRRLRSTRARWSCAKRWSSSAAG
jgi:hypothetical protein